MTVRLVHNPAAQFRLCEFTFAYVNKWSFSNERDWNNCPSSQG